MTDTFGASLGQLIRSQRERQDMTQAELSKAVGLTPVALSRMENGKIANPRESTLDKLLDALDIERGELELLRSGEPVEDTAKRIGQRRNRDLKRELVTTDLRAHLDALEAGEIVSLDIMKELAAAFGGDVETLGGGLESFLLLKAKEYQSLRNEVEAIDDGLKRLSNLKAAAQDAIERVDLDEVEELLSRVQEVELEGAAQTAELRADNALLRGRVDQAFALLTAAANSFAAIDPMASARRRLSYETKLYGHGLRYGGNGIRLAATMVREALADIPKQHEPSLWAEAKNALAAALQIQGSRTDGPDGTALLADAVTAYRDALTVRTKADHPVHWATTTQNLAIALQIQGTRIDGPDGTALLAQAVTAYRDALTVRTKAGHPVHWATTTQNLAIALQIQGIRSDGPDGTALLAQAATAYRDALTVRTKADHPVHWATTTQNLANTLQIQGIRSDGPEGTALLTQAVTAYRDALTVTTKADHPVHWARTQENLAIAERAIADHPATADPRPHLDAALAHVDASLTVYDPDHMSYDYGTATRLRDDILASIAALDE